MTEARKVYVAIRDYGACEGLAEPVYVFATKQLAEVFLLCRDVDRFRLFEKSLIDGEPQEKAVPE